MIVYLVCNNIDLGYHVYYAYTSRARAEAKMAEVEGSDRQKHIKAAYCAGLTYEEAVKTAEQRRKNWEIVETRVEE